MPDPTEELARYLRRAALDPEFLALARRDPSASLAGFALSPEHRARLVRGGAQALDLLALATRATLVAGDDPPDSGQPGPASLPSTTELPPVTLWLGIVPVPAADGSVQHQATLSAAEPEDGARFAIRLQPTLHPLPDGQSGVDYQAAIEPVDGTRAASPTARPWDRDLEDPAVQEAARTVLQAPPEQRRAALEALVDALEGR